VVVDMAAAAVVDMAAAAAVDVAAVAVAVRLEQKHPAPKLLVRKRLGHRLLVKKRPAHKLRASKNSALRNRAARLLEFQRPVRLLLKRDLAPFSVPRRHLAQENPSGSVPEVTPCELKPHNQTVRRAAGFHHPISRWSG
jgi:hypothetical protein